MAIPEKRVRALQAAALISTLLVASLSAAQNYPARPIRLLVSNATGSSPDILARLLAAKLSEQMGQQVVVDNRTGASGLIGVEIAKNAAPDGYTVLVGSTTVFAALPALKSNLPYDLERDFQLLSRIASVANVMVVQASLGVTTVTDFVKHAKANPKKLNCGSSGAGTPTHLAMALFNVMAGVDITHVPYKGAAQVIADLIGGQIQLQFTSPVVAMPHAKGGRVRVLATTGIKRDPLIPELPTVAEAVPGYESTQWFGIAVPARTPKAIVSTLHAEIMKALRSPEVSGSIAKQVATAQPESPEAFARFVREERMRIADVGKRANIRLD
jgi:tripartite-type tricarboxylate transporter receptor subunit TctC